MALLKYESQVREPLVDGDKDYHQVTEDIVRPIEAQPKPPVVDRLPGFSGTACCSVCILYIVKLFMVSGSGTLIKQWAGVGISPTSYGG